MDREANADVGRLQRWLARSAATIAVSTAAFACLAVPALAARTYDSKITPFNRPTSASFDAAGNVWVSDNGQLNKPPGQEGIYKYDPYPSQELLAAPNTYNPWQYYILTLQLSVDQESGEVFVAQANGRTVDIFNDEGEFLREWSGINGATGGGAAGAGIHVAVDNSNTYSRGRVYLSLTSPENDVEAVDAAQQPVQFPGTASYIKGNKLSGTPEGSFGEVQYITVDNLGNIFVTDVGNKVVDEFASTGEFLRSFPAPRANPGNPDRGGVGVDPTDGTVFVTEGGYNGEEETGGVAEFDAYGNFLGRITGDGSGEGFQPEATPAVDSSGHLYLPANNRVDIFNPGQPRPRIEYAQVANPTTTSGTLEATIDPNGGGAVTECQFEYGTSTSYGAGAIPCTPDPAASPPGSHFSSPTEVSAELSGLTTETTYHYRGVVHNANGVSYGSDQTYTPHGVVGLRTDPATEVGESGAQLNGSLVGDGTPTSYLFEWGKTSSYGHSSAAAPGESIGSPSGPGRTQLSFPVSGLESLTTYHYRVVATGGSGTSYGADRELTTLPGVPTIGPEYVSEVHSDRAVMHAQINPNGGRTTYRFEYVTDQQYQESGFAEAVKVPDVEPSIGMGREFEAASASVDGLQPGTVYHYRAVGTNVTGSGVPGVDRTFKTYSNAFKDTCPNAHVRQQTSSEFLLDCRAYELASASDAGGYDVESDLVPGQTPFGGYPQAEEPSRLLYGTHDGGIPGTGNPTNHGVDPYVATRTEDGWTTRYVGIPADNPFASTPFASTLDEANAGLETFAFGGPDICSPCFADGTSGEPIHLPNETLVQGMAGSLEPGPDAEPAGYVGRHLSADGSHFVFGSEQQFEPQGNPDNGNVTIYSRDLQGGGTEVASTDEGGTALADGENVAELDISKNGSHVLIGDLVREVGGNKYWHLYMHIAGSPGSIDLTPETAAGEPISGVSYAGMTEDGSIVYFTTPDQMTADDNDESVDLYRADVTESAATLTRVSTGDAGAGDTDSCEPSANTVHAHWNSLAAEPNCDVLAVGGGGGVASGSGDIYFLSPEALDTSSPGNQPVQGAPNLYLAKPGSEPHYIRTLESSSNAPLPPSAHPYLRSFGAFGNGAGVAIDHSDGDVYVLDIGTEIGTGSVYKYDSEGHSELTFGTNGKLNVAGMLGFYNIPTSLATDPDPSSPNYRDLFVPEPLEGIVKVFTPSGAHVFDIETELPVGVGVDPANGNVYVANYFGGVSIYSPSGTPITSFSTISNPTGVAVDSSGNAYVVNGGGLFNATGTVEVYDSSGSDLGELSEGPANGVAVDPVDDHVYVDQREEVSEFDSAGEPVGSPVGAGLVSESIGVAADSGYVAVSDRGSANVAFFGPAEVPPDPHTDNPVVVDSLSSAGQRHTGDFEVTPSGNDAAFTSTLSLTGYENEGHREVYRYDSPSDAVDCASCNPTGEPAGGEATLPVNGMGLSDDGRVFFNSTEGLVDRDLNNRKDAYEWESGKGIEMISAGTGPLASSLLGVSADGTDAYFFTHDILVHGDDNGNRVKIYDARSFGGFPYVPPEIPCKASDECHGPGSQEPSPPNIGSIAGTPIGNSTSARHRCRKGHRRCRHHARHRRRHRRHHHRGRRHG